MTVIEIKRDSLITSQANSSIGVVTNSDVMTMSPTIVLRKSSPIARPRNTAEPR